MLKTISGRMCLAILSLSIGLLLFHAQIADALVVRGDDLLIQNAYDGAAQRYLRALRLDPDSVAAIDRLAFVALQQRTPAALGAAAARASEYLQRHPYEPAILFDRGLCYLKQRNYELAYSDFLRAAQLTGNPQQFTFAGWAASRAGKVGQAVALWRHALRIRRRYLPAAAALSELGQ